MHASRSACKSASRSASPLPSEPISASSEMFPSAPTTPISSWYARKCSACTLSRSGETTPDELDRPSCRERRWSKNEPVIGKVAAIWSSDGGGSRASLATCEPALSNQLRGPDLIAQSAKRELGPPCAPTTTSQPEVLNLARLAWCASTGAAESTTSLRRTGWSRGTEFVGTEFVTTTVVTSETAMMRSDSSEKMPWVATAKTRAAPASSNASEQRAIVFPESMMSSTMIASCPRTSPMSSRCLRSLPDALCGSSIASVGAAPALGEAKREPPSPDACSSASESKKAFASVTPDACGATTTGRRSWRCACR
mmetsp:Transcript_47975/g.155613  ORF Transcript_47975/g.155613 Transcript_47975/m.155613 type:complete len:311 (+) Transcript_47975:184-1116(+)